MPPKALAELATMVCINHIKMLESVGDFLNYNTIRPILMRIDSAHQLRQIEINSPQIQGLTGEVWTKIIERDFALEYKANVYKPRDPKRWFQVWEKYKREHDDALQQSEKKLMNAFAGLRQDKEKNTSKIVGGRELPRSMRVGGPKRFWGSGGSNGTGIGGRSGTVSGASVMRKVRREVKQIAKVHGSMGRPAQKMLARQPSGVKKAPVFMINNYKRAAQPVSRPLPKKCAGPSISDGHGQGAADDGFTNGFRDEGGVPKGGFRPQVQVTKAGQPAASLPSRQAAASSLVRKFAHAKYPVKPEFGPSIKSMPGGIPPNDHRTPVSKPAQDKGKCAPATPRKSALPVAASASPPSRGDGSPSPPAPHMALKQLAEELQHKASATGPIVRKRKPVDIFMHPKRRAV